MKKRIIGIDYLKCICIILVIFTHYSWSADERSSLLFPFWVDLAIPVLMITTGFNYYNSMKTKRWKMVKSFQRILLPFLITIFIEFIPLMVIDNFSIVSTLKKLIGGGYGPGSYYTIIMIQIILTYPFLYKIINKSKYGWIIPVFIHLLFELFVSIVQMSPALYRLLFFRYIVFLVIGSLIAIKYENREHSIDKLKLGILFIVGSFIVYMLSYTNIKTFLFNNWRTTSMPVSVLALFYFLSFLGMKLKENKMIELISKASFHIYLVQMCYYGFLFPLLENIFSLNYMYIVLNIIICTLIGVIFYSIENKFRGVVLKK